jgi:CBS domain-containing protein
MTEGPHTVRDVMTADVVTVNRTTPFKEIVRMLQQRHISAVPVLEADGRLAGVVSRADLLPKEEFRGSEPGRITRIRRLADLLKAGSVTADGLMTAPAVTVGEDSTLSQAAALMADAKVKQLPVVDSDDRLRGIVSRGDLLTAFLRADGDIADDIRRHVIAAVFPGEPASVQVTVAEGVAVFTGWVADTSRIPLAARLARSVEGVIGLHWDLDEPVPRAEPPVVAPLF